MLTKRLAIRRCPQVPSIPIRSLHHTKKVLQVAGGRSRHPKHERSLIPSEQCQKVVTLKPKPCRGCGNRWTGEDSQPLRYQVWEIPVIESLVTEDQRHRLNCGYCGKSTCFELPVGVLFSQVGR